MTDGNKHKDDITGIETTGHEWDGIRELNNPLPKWWVYVFYITVVWAVLYWIAMPSIPLIDSYTKGLLGYSQREAVAAQINAVRMERAQINEQLMSLPIDKVKSDPELFRFAISAAESAFGDNCATCHGSGAQGSKGYPNLNDDDWIWGGTLEEIEQTIRFGVRSEAEQTRFTMMPLFVQDELISRDDAWNLVEYVRFLSGEEHNPERAQAAAQLFEDECASCHTSDGTGDQDLGAVNLADKISLFGNSKDELFQSIANMKPNVMPAWHNRLDDATIRALAIYVHSRGGGE